MYSMFRLYLLGSLLQFATAIVPQSLRILNSTVRDCDFATSTQISANKTSINMLFDTTKSIGSTPDSLAWTDSVNYTESTCIVCTSFKWSSTPTLYGSIMSVDYDFYHRLDPGLLEQVASHITRENSSDEEYFESAYTYGSVDTAKTYRFNTSVANASEPLLLDYAKDHESICVQTWFRVGSRGGVYDASGEIAKKSVFTQSVNIDWHA